jgi:hypothetical protein
MNFCYLEKDVKNYEYFKRYYKLKENCTEFFKLDNKIQFEEITKHIENHHGSPHNQNTAYEWIRENGEKFRHYINTLKIICLVFKCMNKTDITQEEFFEMESRINNLKGSCLETIF